MRFAHGILDISRITKLVTRQLTTFISSCLLPPGLRYKSKLRTDARTLWAHPAPDNLRIFSCAPHVYLPRLCSAPHVPVEMFWP